MTATEVSATSQDGPQSLVTYLLGGSAEHGLRLLGAQGLLPLEMEERLRVLLAMGRDADPEIGSAARESLAAIRPDEWLQFLEYCRPDAADLDALSGSTEDSSVLEAIVRHRETSDETLARIAASASESVQEVLVTNQVRLLQNPELIDRLLENPGLSNDSRRRLAELKEEFFDKAERRRLALASEEELAALAEAAEEESAGLEAESPESGSAPAMDVELAQKPELKELHQRIAYMTAAEKIHEAVKGGSDSRAILILDVSRQVREAVLACPKLNERDVLAFAGLRQVEEDVLRVIGTTPEWTRRYPIIHALVANPKTPPDVAMVLVPRLRLRDLRLLSRDRNLAEAVRATVRKFYLIKRGD